ncbi:ATP-binding cassette domain-containing protein, partial [Planococcus sp. SIMBA_143]
MNAKDRLAVVGRNGTGKTTLFQLLAGLEGPDAGTIIRTKNTQIGYLDQIPDCSGYSVYEGLNESFSGVHE